MSRSTWSDRWVWNRTCSVGDVWRVEFDCVPGHIRNLVRRYPYGSFRSNELPYSGPFATFTLGLRGDLLVRKWDLQSGSTDDGAFDHVDIRSLATDWTCGGSLVSSGYGVPPDHWKDQGDTLDDVRLDIGEDVRKALKTAAALPDAIESKPRARRTQAADIAEILATVKRLESGGGGGSAPADAQTIADLRAALVAAQKASDKARQGQARAEDESREATIALERVQEQLRTQEATVRAARTDLKTLQSQLAAASQENNRLRLRVTAAENDAANAKAAENEAKAALKAKASDAVPAGSILVDRSWLKQLQRAVHPDRLTTAKPEVTERWATEAVKLVNTKLDELTTHEAELLNPKKRKRT